MTKLILIGLVVLLTGCEGQQGQASHMAYRYTDNCYDDSIVTNMTQDGDVKTMVITCRVRVKRDIGGIADRVRTN